MNDKSITQISSLSARQTGQRSYTTRSRRLRLSQDTDREMQNVFYSLSYCLFVVILHRGYWCIFIATLCTFPMFLPFGPVNYMLIDILC